MMISTINTNEQMMNLAIQLAEDAGAPELRNPLNSGMRAIGLREWLFCHKRKIAHLEITPEASAVSRSAVRA